MDVLSTDHHRAGSGRGVFGGLFLLSAVPFVPRAGAGTHIHCHRGDGTGRDGHLVLLALQRGQGLWPRPAAPAHVWPKFAEGWLGHSGFAFLRPGYLAPDGGSLFVSFLDGA